MIARAAIFPVGVGVDADPMAASAAAGFGRLAAPVGQGFAALRQRQQAEDEPASELDDRPAARDGFCQTFGEFVEAERIHLVLLAYAGGWRVRIGDAPDRMQPQVEPLYAVFRQCLYSIQCGRFFNRRCRRGR
jgi:hypothetical protein